MQRHKYLLMKFVQEADKLHFTLNDLSFTDIKTLRDALKAFAKGGSTQAAKLVAEIEAGLDQAQV